MDFCCITTFFNPAKYKSLLNNYFIFKANLEKQKVPLLTVELAFENDDFLLPNEPNVLKLRSNSILWQKEKLINYAVTKLPKECHNFAWVDCDIVFPDNWHLQALEQLKTHNIIQLFKKVIHLPQGDTEFKGKQLFSIQGIVWQKQVHRNWLERRKRKDLPFSAPGFAWAAKKDVFEDIKIYDKNIVGSGDTFLTDCYFNSWEIHGYAQKFNDYMKEDMEEWKKLFNNKSISIGYIPIDVCHLWHGSMKNRRYMDRHEIIKKHDYNPKKDIVLTNDVYEWNSDKLEMHKDIKQYFFDRKEDVNG